MCVCARLELLSNFVFILFFFSTFVFSRAKCVSWRENHFLFYLLQYCLIWLLEREYGSTCKNKSKRINTHWWFEPAFDCCLPQKKQVIAFIYYFIRLLLTRKFQVGLSIHNKQSRRNWIFNWWNLKNNNSWINALLSDSYKAANLKIMTNKVGRNSNDIVIMTCQPA